MLVAMRHDGRPGSVESIGDRRVAPCAVHCLIAPLLFLFLPRFPCQEFHLNIINYRDLLDFDGTF